MDYDGGIQAWGQALPLTQDRPSFCSSASVTLEEPELVSSNFTGPAGTLAGCGAHPASDRAIFTVAPCSLDPAPPPAHPASRTALQANRQGRPNGRLGWTSCQIVAFPAVDTG